jgi:hypothetical protein
MVYVTPGIRWSIGVWCAATLGLVAGGISQGLQPATLGVLLFVTAAPVIVLVTLTRFRREARTASQVLYDKPDDPR